jgi:erythronate-4-phosphate dehydrogenase
MIGSVKILADENIPYVREAFGSLGRVELANGRAITRAMLSDTDLLLVRSITRVDEPLLAGTAVKMVATATIGTDHIDQEYLARAGIAFASAAGSNSNSVSEYLTAALLTLARRKNLPLTGQTIGVIGVGNVGSKVAYKCRQLGMHVLKNDPPLQEMTGTGEYCDLPRLLAESDFVTVHVPLVMKGRWPTFHMVNDSFIRKMKPAAWLLNSSRGTVVDEPALKEALRTDRLAGAVLDVWENEPAIDVALLSQAAIATPHIAGYSFDGKVNGTEMIYQAACRFLGVPADWNPKLIMPPPPVPMMRVAVGGHAVPDLLEPIVKAVYDIEADDERLRELIALPEEKRSRHFDQLRKHYPVRREFPNTRIEFSEETDDALKRILVGLGFLCAS